MLTPSNYNPPYKFKWVERTIPVAEGSSETTTKGYMENYKNVSQDIRNQLDAKAEAVQIILTGIDNDIYSTVDACLNACEMWKAIERDGETLKSYYSRLYKMMNELVRNQCDVTNNQVNVQFLLQLQPEWQRNRGKAIVNSPPPIYDQEPDMVAEDDALSKENEIDKLMALISLSFNKIYKPTNNNLKTSSNTRIANQDNTPRINRRTGYDNQRAVNVVGARENVVTHVVQKFGIQYYNCKEYRHVARECQKPKLAKDAAYHKEKMLLYQKLEAHYLYMAQVQEVTPDTAENFGPIFEAEPLQKVQNDDDNYNVFANNREYPEQPEYVNDTYSDEQEHDLLASLIEKLKCEIDESKDHNKLLESSNKTLIDKLKGEIEDFKNKNKILESNNHFKKANTELAKNNQLVFKDLNKFQAKLDMYHDVNYASKVEIDCAKDLDDTNYDNHLLNYVLHHQRLGLSKSVDSDILFDIAGRTLLLGRAEFCLVTGFACGKVVFPKYLDDDIPPFVRRLFLDKLKKLEKNKAGLEESAKGKAAQPSDKSDKDSVTIGHLGELVPDKAAKGKAAQPSDKGDKVSVMIRDQELFFRGQEDSNPTTKLQPTDAEMGQNWYRKSYDCLDGKEKSVQLDDFGGVSDHDDESDSYTG
ncbi:hypothetical protein Tco_0633255 [Tanacetum coccineum]